MNAVSEDIKDILELESNWVFKQDLFCGREPNKPNNILTIFDAPGQGPAVLLEAPGDENDIFDYSAFQIRTRNTDYFDGMQMAWEALTKLHNKGNYEINNTLYSIQAMDTPSPLEWDENNRVKIVVNFFAQRTPKPT